MGLVLQTILPVTILIAFGFVLGELGIFDKVATAALVRFSVTIVVPVAIFLQVLKTSRSQLTDFTFIAVLTIAFLGIYAIGFAVSKLLLGRTGRESIVAAACVSYPNLALLGLPIYGAFVGQSLAAVSVAVGNTITSLTIVPFTMAILAASTRTAGKGEKVSLWSLLWGQSVLHWSGCRCWASSWCCWGSANCPQCSKTPSPLWDRPTRGSG